MASDRFQGAILIQPGIAAGVLGEIGMGADGRPSAYYGGAVKELAFSEWSSFYEGTLATSSTAFTSWMNAPVPVGGFTYGLIRAFGRYNDNSKFSIQSRECMFKNVAGVITSVQPQTAGGGGNTWFTRVGTDTVNDNDQIALNTNGNDVQIGITAETSAARTWTLMAWFKNMS